MLKEKSVNAKAQKEKVERNNEILLGYLDGSRQVDLARKYGLSRQRVEQILKQMTGHSDPNYLMNIDLDWEMINEFRKSMGLNDKMISEVSGRSRPMVRKVLSCDSEYIHSIAASNVLSSILILAERRLDMLEEITQMLGSAIKNKPA